MSDEAAMTRVSAQHHSISDKIRALHAEGYGRSQIARFLNRHPTQVRNVIKNDEIRGRRFESGSAPPASVQESAARFVEQTASPKYFRLSVEPGGKVALPGSVLQQFDVQEEDVVMARLEGGSLVIDSPEASIKRIQALVRSLNLAPGRMLSEELLEDRRREVEDEAARG